MLKWLDKIPYSPLIVVAILLFMAPFSPMPHVIEKFIMLKTGTLHKPIHIIDLVFHLIPTILIVLKLARSVRR